MKDNIPNLLKANKILTEDIMGNKSFSVEEKEALSERLDILIKQLSFWTQQSNLERFAYDLRDQIHWVIKNFAEKY